MIVTIIITIAIVANVIREHSMKINTQRNYRGTGATNVIIRRRFQACK